MATTNTDDGSKSLHIRFAEAVLYSAVRYNLFHPGRGGSHADKGKFNETAELLEDEIKECLKHITLLQETQQKKKEALVRNLLTQVSEILNLVAKLLAILTVVAFLSIVISIPASGILRNPITTVLLSVGYFAASLGTFDIVTKLQDHLNKFLVKPGPRRIALILTSSDAKIYWVYQDLVKLYDLVYRKELLSTDNREPGTCIQPTRFLGLAWGDLDKFECYVIDHDWDELPWDILEDDV
ncbi:hypothetical protein QBC38DRAFT_490282 [Podospora fimiseda]|uniref:Uncharacterized protein n=1 Tax=Podospora fimiseda TaxID=252190 RepID=A0AAN7BFN9_9PEZI|nr:hypothetical protein QBC38DRAFT_490282 [Podospora fimiseda]